MELRYPLTRYVYRPVSIPVATLLAKTPITPTHVTYVSALLSFGGGAAFAMRAYVLGAVLTLLGSITDCVDGDLARVSGRTSKSGSYLDHVLDRWTDAALIVGLTFSDLNEFGGIGMAALVGTFMVSYARTKAQAVGTDCEVGLASRDARMLILVIAGVTGLIYEGLVVVAVLGLGTAVYRMFWTIRKLDSQ
jgi:CDP-diacylglycerol--glycerol-3-phosphate 3-phosphatidyltransferase